MKSLSTKLTTLMLIICGAGMTVLVIIALLISASITQKQVLEKVSQNTAKEAERINGWLENQTSYALAFSIDASYLEEYSREYLMPLLNHHVNGSEQYFDVYMGFPDGVATFSSGFIPSYENGWAAYKRPWYIGATKTPDISHITDPYTDVQTGGLCITAAKTVYKEDEFVGVAAVDILINELNDIVVQTSVGKGSYAFLTDASGGILIHPGGYGPDSDDVFQNIQEIEGGLLSDAWNSASQDGVSFKAKGIDGAKWFYTAHTVEATGWKLFTALPADEVYKSLYLMAISFAIVLVIVLAVAFKMISITVSRIIVRPIAEVTVAAEQLAQGTTDIDIQGDYNDEIGQLVHSFKEMAQSVQTQADATMRIASEDLTSPIEVRSENDVVGIALKDLQNNLRRIIASIVSSAEQVSDSSQSISNSAEMLTSGSVEQSAVIEELTESITRIAEDVRQNAQKTASATAITDNISRNTEQNAKQMESLTVAVNEINETVTGISDIIKIIDNIAFQTNILALNASVEAARAGTYGTGFVVVAKEVRVLAQKSANAANDITELINEAIEKVNNGVRIAKETGASMNGILEGVYSATKITDEISDDFKKQSNAVLELKSHVEHVSDVVSANAASAVHSTETAFRLQTASEQLTALVNRFALPEGDI